MDIPMQKASQDIYKKKYQLHDSSGNPVDVDEVETFQRVAKALASVEKMELRANWELKFYLCMIAGAIPAGRILSNAGASGYKPNTSLINCVVSKTIHDSMEGILSGVYDSGLSLSAGCGIGYDFSTLRPRGAFVKGVGATTSGPVSFMDIYDKMCFTIASAGGRRGAQMATMDVQHPDIIEYIHAKREDGRLRQFNLSILISKHFMEMVKDDKDLDLVFPLDRSEAKREGMDFVMLDYNEPIDGVVYRKWSMKSDRYFEFEGLTACKVYKTVKASYVWDEIMKSTYDFAEPGFILIDRVNEYNNNWFCEDIRSTNPCVTGDTLVLTDKGNIPIIDLVGKKTNVWNGFEYSKVTPLVTGINMEILDIEFSNGSKLSCTRYHKFILSDGAHVEAKDLRNGTKLPQYTLPDEDAEEWLSERIYVTKISTRKKCEGKVYCFTEPKNHTGVFNGIMTGNCGEQPLPPEGSCLLGSINLTKFVEDPFTKFASFDTERYIEVISVFTRMLDNVVELNGLALEGQRKEIIAKRRHGMGYLGLGSAISMLGLEYGSPSSLEFCEEVTKLLAITGFKVGCDLAREKGMAPALEKEYEVTGELRSHLVKNECYGDILWHMESTVKGKELWARSKYMLQIKEEDADLWQRLRKYGSRFTHHSSIAPTGTISLSLANNASAGIEPTFSHKYVRNIVMEGKKTKEQVEVLSYEALVHEKLHPGSPMPDHCSTTDNIDVKKHIDMQAAAQKWVDSSISKTCNVPTDYPFDKFKDLYFYAYEKGLKGMTTFRFNPEVFSGVLVKQEDLDNTEYSFTMEDGTLLKAKGNDTIEYEGETHVAANLFDALKEGYYGKL